VWVDFPNIHGRQEKVGELKNLLEFTNKFDKNIALHEKPQPILLK
jgi:hypothetical protein